MDRVGLTYYNLGKLGIDGAYKERNVSVQHKRNHLLTFEIKNNTEEFLKLRLQKSQQV